MDLVILNHGQMTRTTPELAPSGLTPFLVGSLVWDSLGALGQLLVHEPRQWMSVPIPESLRSSGNCCHVVNALTVA
ncbi:hypothetical protein AVEN_229079-1 [Araneus ventricosus]|uniref:Uncharacterized protein n=1 Tax=Araneus ventricosus TaxID=182803 RepID=A0A4Y2BLJ7_ARAVE|nr:hypothetical protein AVEN_229079-1 [Araneus ventricosus]